MHLAQTHTDCCKSFGKLEGWGLALEEPCPPPARAWELILLLQTSPLEQDKHLCPVHAFLRGCPHDEIWNLSLLKVWFGFSFNISVSSSSTHTESSDLPFASLILSVMLVLLTPLSSNWELNMKFGEKITTITLTVVLICWDLSRFLKA